MGTRRHTKTGYGRTPAKGTKARTLLLLALRPQGVTAWEIAQANGMSRDNGLGALVNRLVDQNGYDIRGFPVPRDRRAVERFGPLRPGASGRMPMIYRLVGKYRWSGTYRSFVNQLVKERPNE